MKLRYSPFFLIFSFSFVVFLTNAIAGSDVKPLPIDEKEGIPFQHVHIAPESIETDRLRLVRVRSSQAYIDCYNVLFADGGNKTDWFTGLDSTEKPEERMKVIKMKEELGYYKLPISFSHYNVHSKDTDDLIGRFCFIGCGKEDRLETGIYLVQSAQKKGFGSEILSGVLEHIVTPALGKPYYTDETRAIDPEYEELSKDDIKLTFHPAFKGVYAKCDTFHNYGSLAAHHRAGYKIQWVDSVPLMLYPAAEESYLADPHVDHLLKITKTFSTVAEVFSQMLKIFHPEVRGQKLFLSDIMPFLNSGDLEEECDALIENLELLSQTDEPHTLISAIDLWIDLEVDREELKDLISAKKAKSLLNLSRNGDPYSLSAQLVKKHEPLIKSLIPAKRSHRSHSSKRQKI
jgi:RimJ/RimL family protein N-acetyltransferase